MYNSKENLKINLRRAMNLEHLSAHKLQKQSDISTSTISSYLAGTQSARIETLDQLAKALHTTASALIGEPIEFDSKHDNTPSRFLKDSDPQFRKLMVGLLRYGISKCIEDGWTPEQLHSYLQQLIAEAMES